MFKRAIPYLGFVLSMANYSQGEEVEVKPSKVRHRMKSIKLESKGLSCAVEAENGAKITQLRVQGEEIFKFKEKKDHATPSLGVVALIPCVHHASLSELVWHGTGHPALSDQVSAEQMDWGLGWQSHWQILEQEEDCVLLSFEHRAEKKWPWLFDASQVIRLHERALYLTLSLTNQSNVASPVGLGWAFNMPIMPKDRLTLNAKSEIKLSHSVAKERTREDVNHEKTNHSTGFDRSIQELGDNMGYSEWGGDACLNAEKYRLSLSSSLKTLQAIPSKERDVLLLKVLNVPLDVVKHAAPAQMLAPGESMSIEMRMKIDVSHTMV